MKSCGSCKHFLKIKTVARVYALCLLHDQRTGSDHGRGCSVYKRVKFHKREAIEDKEIRVVGRVV